MDDSPIGISYFWPKVSINFMASTKNTIDSCCRRPAECQWWVTFSSVKKWKRTVNVVYSHFIVALNLFAQLSKIKHKAFVDGINSSIAASGVLRRGLVTLKSFRFICRVFKTLNRVSCTLYRLFIETFRLHNSYFSEALTTSQTLKF